MAKRPQIMFKFLCGYGRRRIKCVLVLFLVCFIYIFFIFNGPTFGEQYKRMEHIDISKNRLISHNTSVLTERTTSERKTRHVIHSNRKQMLNVTEIPMKLSSKTLHQHSNIHLTQRLDSNLINVTLKPGFSKMINASQVVSTIDAPYLLENKNICSSVKNLSTLIIVHSACDHFTRRQLSRQTWANHSFYASLGVFRILFLLGKPNDEKIQKRISEENEKYKDILQGDFIDTYHNLTLKGVMAYKWLSERCINAKFILKIDDDIVINMFMLFEDILPRYAGLRRQIVCNHIYKDSMPIIRKNNSKWFVPQSHFRNLNAYPTDYCSGFMVLFTNDLMSAFYRSAVVTPFFWVDDVYLYGLVPGNVPGIRYSNFPGHWDMLDGQKALRCYRNTTGICDYLAIGGGGKGEIDDVWAYIVKRYFLSILARQK